METIYTLRIQTHDISTSVCSIVPPTFLTVQRISTHVRTFCHLLGAQRLWFACFIYLLIFGLHLSLFLTVVSIKCDLPHQPIYTANVKPFEFNLQFLDFPSHFSFALSASFDVLPLESSH